MPFVFLLAYVAVIAAISFLKGMVPPEFRDLAWGTASSIALVGLTALFLRRDHRTMADVGMRPDHHTITRLIASTLLGLALYPLTLALISITVAPLHLSTPHWPTTATLLLTVASFLALSAMEELGFRAYALRSLAQRLGPWRAQAIVAVAFGLSHLLYGWPWTTVVLGVIPSGLLFGALAIRRGGLAIAIGVHAALNISRWLVGEKETPGIWTLDADPAHAARLATNAPIVATLMVLLATVIVWRWPARAT